MKDDNLWPVDVGGGGYFGETKRTNAFNDANTSIVIVKNYPDIPTNVDLSTVLKLLQWTITKAGGDLNKLPSYGLDRNIAILCSVENIPNYNGQNMNNNTHGFTWQRGDQLSAMAYVLADRIRNANPNSYDRTRSMVGVGIHELGHARGIDGDDGTVTGLIPSCTTGSSTCVMHSPYSIEWFTNPRFCNAHKTFINGVTW